MYTFETDKMVVIVGGERDFIVRGKSTRRTGGAFPVGAKKVAAMFCLTLYYCVLRIPQIPGYPRPPSRLSTKNATTHEEG